MSGDLSFISSLSPIRPDPGAAITRTPPRVHPDPGAPISSTPPGIQSLHLPTRPPRQRTPWEEPQTTQHQPPRPSPLRQGLALFDVPLAGIESVGSDVIDRLRNRPTTPQTTQQLAALRQSGPVWNWLARSAGAHGAQFLTDLQQGGPQRVANYDIAFRRGSLERTLQDPTSTPLERQQAQYFLDHPYQAGAMDFLAEWFNPGTYAGGELLGLGSRVAGVGLRYARGLSPELDYAAMLGSRAAGTVSHAAQAGMVRAGRAILSRIPGAADTLRALTDRYYSAGLPQRGGMPYLTAALAAHMYPEYQAGRAVDFIRELGHGLTLAQKRELQKLSYLDTDTGAHLAVRNPAVPEPRGLSLETRAQQLRQWMMQRDTEQNQLGIRPVEEGRQYNSGLFWPMRQFAEDSPVYDRRVLNPEESAAAMSEQTSQNIAQRVGARSRYASTVSKSRQKVIPTILNPGVEQALHAEYDPIYQLEQHYGPTVRAIANEQVKRDLEHLPSIDPATGTIRTANIIGHGEQPLHARMPANYALQQRSGDQLVFGQGEAGRVARERYIERVVKAKAQAKALQDPTVLRTAEQEGIDPSLLGTRRLVQRSAAPVTARLREAMQAGKLTGRLTQRAGQLLERRADVELERQAAQSTEPANVTAKTSEDAAAAARAANEARRQALSPSRLARFRASQAEAARAAGIGTKQAQRVADLTTRVVRASAESRTAQAYARAVSTYRRQLFESTAAGIRERSVQAIPGYSLESKLQIGSPTARDMMLDDSFGNFFQQAPWQPKPGAARAVWQTYQVLNRLMRSSIILFPTVHAINNLGMHFLAEGGTPLEMARIVAGKYIPRAGLEEAAARDGALSQMGAMGLFGREGAHATTEMGERAGIISSRTHVPQPLVRGYLRVSDFRQHLNDWIFGDVQRGYELSLYDKFTREGMTGGEAALRVRQAMGRYDDINSGTLNSLFYFVPWMKTVIPFWVKKGVLDPRWWTAPVGAIMTANQIQGYDDPSKPFQATLGPEPNGEWRLGTVPIPQRVLGMLADVGRIPFDLMAPGSSDRTANLREDVSAPVNYFSYHENPFVQAVTGGIQLASGNAPPWNPWTLQPGQSALPAIPEKLGMQAIAPWSRVQGAMQDPWSLLAYPLGASVYAKPDARQAMRQKALRATMTQIGNALSRNTNPERAATLQQKLQALQQRLAGASPQVIKPDPGAAITTTPPQVGPIHPDPGAPVTSTPPTKVSYWNTQAQEDMPHTSPAMQRAFQAVAPYAPLVTSVMHGIHEGPTSGPNEDPHYAGRAVDVGAFGGTPVGDNEATATALAAAIRSHQFSKIGTISDYADDPQWHALAADNHVILFDDPGTGPHVHFEVP